jgi:hypothetical protein
MNRAESAPFWSHNLLDPQVIFNIAWGLVTALVGGLLNELWTAVKSLRQDLSILREEVAKDYVPKEDYRRDMSAIRDGLQRIYDKLDHKVDK